MRSKRSRFSRSWTHGEFGVFTQVLPIDSSLFGSKRSGASSGKGSKRQSLSRSQRRREDESRWSVFAICSPERELDSETTLSDEQFGAFFHTCASCKKKLDLADSIYMYGYLGAFCSPSCRDDRMVLDGFADTVDIIES